MSDDLIKRSDAIGACAYETIECYEARKTIRALPSADRPQGEWRNYKDEHYCSHCGEVVISDWYTEDEWYDFCPNCGARMKGADDE